MSKSKFTQSQAGDILDAVQSFIDWNGDAYPFIRHIHEMQYNYLEHAVEESAEIGGDMVLQVTTDELNVIVMNNKILTDLLYRIQDALPTRTRPSTTVNTPGK